MGTAFGPKIQGLLFKTADAFAAAETGTKGFTSAIQKFSGTGIVGEANAYAKALDAVGGASTLTAREQAQVNATVTEAIAKYRALGQDAPAALHALAAATAAIPPVPAIPPKAPGFFDDLTGQVKATALGFISAQAVIGSVQ